MATDRASQITETIILLVELGQQVSSMDLLEVEGFGCRCLIEHSFNWKIFKSTDSKQGVVVLVGLTCVCIERRLSAFKII